MITFDKDDTRFLFRTVAIFQDEGYVLLHKIGDHDFWALPGGRVELLEKSETAVLREMKEELDVEASIERLVWVVENFFAWNEKSFHELSHYFLLHLPVDSPRRDKNKDFHSIDAGTPLLFRWFPLQELETLDLYPSFLRTGLQSLPTEIRHITHIDNDGVTVT